MPISSDYSITNRARAVLRRHWMDSRYLTCGSVNGTVYLRGQLRRDPLCRAPRAPAADDQLALIQVLKRDLEGMEGVRDVIFEVEGFERRGEHWERTNLTGSRGDF